MDSINAPQPIRCRAAVTRAGGEPMVIEEVEVAPPKAWEVRIKIICTSLCHSDVSFWMLKNFPGVYPRIFGHEAIGIVESVGEHVEELSIGDTVVPTFLAHCSECKDCKSKTSNMCSKFPFRIDSGMPRDRTTRFTDAQGAAIHNLFGISSFSEYTVVDMAQLVKVDPSVSHDKACLLSCGVSTGEASNIRSEGVGAAWKVAAVEAGSTLAIFGLGAVGLAVAEGARIRGAARIIGVDLNPDKFDIGKKFGITDFINPNAIGERPISEMIKEMTDGGADYCFECIGQSTLMQQAFQSSREGWGKTIILGVQMHGAPLSIMPNEILRGKCVMGSLFGGIKGKVDIPILIEQYLNKELQLDKFITHELGLQDINEAFDLLINGKSLRCIIWMDR